MQRAAESARTRGLRSSRSATSLAPQMPRILPSSNEQNDPAVRRPAFQDLGRLTEDIVAAPAGRSSRVRKKPTAYTDEGASTRKKKPTDVTDGMDVIASIMATLRQSEQVPMVPEQVDKRTTQEKHPADARLLKMRNCEAKQKKKEGVQRRKEIELAQLSRLKEELLLTKSWLDRKEMAFLAYATALGEGHPKMKAYEAAAKAAFVSHRCVRSWCPEYIDNGGEFAANLWGKSGTHPSAFRDTEVRLKGAKWLRSHPPTKGVPSIRMCDFKEYMVGTEDKPGPIRAVMEEIGKEDYSEEMFRQFAIDLGFRYDKKDKGTFNDEHESIFNQEDRRNRFFPQYMHFYERSPHMYHGHDTDDLDDINVRDRHFVTVVGTDGTSRKISLGGELPPGAHLDPELPVM